jgi:hypothetical protein
VGCAQGIGKYMGINEVESWLLAEISVHCMNMPLYATSDEKSNQSRR